MIYLPPPKCNPMGSYDAVMPMFAWLVAGISCVLLSTSWLYSVCNLASQFLLPFCVGYSTPSKSLVALAVPSIRLTIITSRVTIIAVIAFIIITTQFCFLLLLSATIIAIAIIITINTYIVGYIQYCYHKLYHSWMCLNIRYPIPSTGWLVVW